MKRREIITLLGETISAPRIQNNRNRMKFTSNAELRLTWSMPWQNAATRLFRRIRTRPLTQLE